MRYLGIDYGEKRIGLALSDETGKIALPYKTITRAQTTKTEIALVVRHWEIEKIVVGIPIPFSGGTSHQSDAVRKFVASLARYVKIPIEFQNEVLTTAFAKKQGIPQKHLDKAAAVIILQSYLDRVKRVDAFDKLGSSKNPTGESKTQ